MASTFGKTFLIFVMLIILVSCASQVMSSTLQESSIAEKYKQWMAKYGRTYPDEAEKERRRNIFKGNLEYIEKANKERNRTYKLSINEFSDLTNEEFIVKYTGYKKSSQSRPSTTSFRYKNLNDVPTSMDWREKGAVTPVKRQGKCACCWAFSAVAAMEAITQIHLGLLIPLSEQQLLDCSSDGNTGCEGGRMDNAFAYIIQNEGLTTEKNYPYQETQETCEAYKGTDTFDKISKYEYVPINDEQSLLKAVSMQPVSIGIDGGGGDDFRHYKNGVFNGKCGTELNHAVTTVGYGTTEDGMNYWLIKNSWGADDWGEGGYMRIQRDVGLCGLALEAVYPIL